MFDLTKRPKIAAEWAHFCKAGAADPDIVREFILDSWKRSRALGVDPARRSPGNFSVSDDELEESLIARDTLIHMALPVMRKLYGYLKYSHSVIMLTDENGILLAGFGEAPAVCSKDELSPGICYSENLLGTNGVGTCLVENRPVRVWAEEHYCEFFRKWNSAAAPIHGSMGEIIGCLNIASLRDNVNFHNLGMVSMMADAIQDQYKKEIACEARLRIMHERHALSELISDGILVVGPDMTISQINTAARRILNTGSLEPKGRPVTDLILGGVDFRSIMGKGTGISDREATLTIRSGTVTCLMSTAVLKAHGSLVITLKEGRLVRRMVNRVTGSRAALTFDHILGQSVVLKEALALAEIAAGSLSHVLITGENGTGKELFAQGIHNAGPRRDGPFIAINCGALPRNLIQSELFGYEGGTFTGSRKEGNPGKFELADGGTLLLDEIGDMPLDAQVNLLRVIQNGEVVRVGGKYPKKIDVRIIASTNKDLHKAVSDNTFREDLYFRLNVFPIHVPPLRERFGDIPVLADYFLKKSAAGIGRNIMEIHGEALALLGNYGWSGNVRELENTMERAVNIAAGHQITWSDLPKELFSCLIHEKPKAVPGRKTLRGKEMTAISAALAEHRGNLRKSAESLGIARSTLYLKMKKYGLSAEEYRAA